MDSLALVRELTNFGLTLLVALLVWAYYRHKIFPSFEKYSTFGPRFWTPSVDECVLWPASFATSYLFWLQLPSIVKGLLLIVGSVSWLLYTVIMHALYGQTVGKMVTKVRVVDFQTERGISWRQAWLREGIPMALNLGFLSYQLLIILRDPSAVARNELHEFRGSSSSWLLAALPGLWFVAEIVTMLTNDKRRALHDFIAGTVVIRTNVREGTEDAPLPALD